METHCCHYHVAYGKRKGFYKDQIMLGLYINTHVYHKEDSLRPSSLANCVTYVNTLEFECHQTFQTTECVCSFVSRTNVSGIITSYDKICSDNRKQLSEVVNKICSRPWRSVNCSQQGSCLPFNTVQRYLKQSKSPHEMTQKWK